jgi:choline dehydrogenase
MEFADTVVYDYIVIGGGSAGAIMAARLSEYPGCSVLLLEAGPDYADPVTMPPDLLDSNVPVTSGHNWNLLAARRRPGIGGQSANMARVAKVFEVASNRLSVALSAPALVPGEGDTFNQLHYPMARVMGGGSAVNGALALHASAYDYDAWAAAGNDFWRWALVQPWIRRFDEDVAARWALTLEAAQPINYTRLQRAFGQTCLSRGLPAAGTANAMGLRSIPKLTLSGARASTAAIYLVSARERTNLHIVPDCVVDRILMARRGVVVQADGVDAIVDGARRSWRARHVVLTAGAIHSPAILLRSGVGAAAALGQLGVAQWIEAPGVGRNLQDHPTISLWNVATLGSYSDGEPIHQLMLEHTSNGTAQGEFQLLMLSAVPTARFPPLDVLVGAPAACGITVMLARPLSTGCVELLQRDPLRAPRICLNLLENEQDMQCAVKAVRLAWSLLQSEPLRGMIGMPVLWNQAIMDSDKLLARAIDTTVRAAWHPVGTLRMGPDSDHLAVVDQYGALRGCSNVTVADASIMPTIPGVPTNLTCMLVAERLAERLVNVGARSQQ